MSDLDRIPSIKDYIENLFGQEDETLRRVRQNCETLKIPLIHVPPQVGKLLHLLTRLKKPKRVLEIGTLGGYSAIWMAKALENDGQLLTIEINSDNAKIAKANIQEANLSDKIEILEGDALDILKSWQHMPIEKFDMVFIDADKENYHAYLELIKPHLNHEALILSDNLIPKWKEIGNPHPKDMMAKAIYQYNQALAQDNQLSTAIVTTIVGQTPRVDGLGISLFMN